jgi:3',5'-cyclic AMP phosphodiesterase CpdA
MIRMRTIRLIVTCVAAGLLASCAGFHYRFAQTPSLLARPVPPYPAVRFAVISDPHLYDTGLGVEGAAFQEYMEKDRKLLPESHEILSEALERVKSLGAGFLLVCGDLTKDGERQDHLLMAKELSRSGIRVFVIPGNHDILNPHAMSFSEHGVAPVPSVTPADFAEIYRDFGYGDALFRDSGSLGYVAEPVPGLWLLAVDSASYSANAAKGRPETGPGLTQGRVDWMEEMLAEARRRDKAVIVMMHHGVMEHFPGQARYYGEYLVNDRGGVAAMCAAYGVRAVFTGHFHAQDVTVTRTGNGGVLYDIETGSLASFPNPVRNIEITASQNMRIRSSFITEIHSFAAEGRSFEDFARESLWNDLGRIAMKTMKGLGVPEREASEIAPQIADAFLAHYTGDEKFTGGEMLKSRGLGLMAGIVVGSRKDLVTGLWRDLPPADNNLDIDLATGSWTAAPYASAGVREYALGEDAVAAGVRARYFFAAASSSSASRAFGTVSSGFTLYQTRASVPVSSTRNDDLMMPL